MKRLAVLALVLAAPLASAAPRDDGTSPPPPGAPNMVVPTRPTLTWFGVQVSDPPGVHLQLSAEAVVGTTVEGQTLIVTITGVDLDSRQRWSKVDLRKFESMPIVSIDVSRASNGALVRLEFKPGIVPTATPTISRGTDGFTYVLLDLSGAAVPATPVTPTTEPTEPDGANTLPVEVEDHEMGELRTREGFTFDISAGIGISQLRSSGGAQTEFAVSGPNLSLGAWINDATAILVRASVGTGFVSNNDDDEDSGGTIPFTSLAFTAGAQRNLGGAYFIAGGLGAGRLLVDWDDSGETGFAVDIRGGMTFKPTQHGTYFLAAEVTPVFYKESNTIITAALQVGWQLY